MKASLLFVKLVAIISLLIFLLTKSVEDLERAGPAPVRGCPSLRLASACTPP
ncbi:hypothetical protein ERO13_A05G296950v2 [Gossypium hirsutum]|uniref:Uncharacterized protein n=4 Tax=Gossypium TaxID=3633 RepID=A0A5J5VX72_GOSBA|nr:hypothetical protein ES319_A05G311500v1 [Gossypium barbadense]KAG4201732.1 hypothetical protein ERO13_A05G296950v2 [Gossypium hirsutum]TYH19109.1 hypothetical protein ES288_A05G326600v1 [Gossypium darwinii]TYI29595.1 hypothetical protein ES332_A05G327500v1 [Gossypium tomentosum]TYJ36628.1 hypothetical protein E1A91_A05G319800v1 [Gossypium mustelinum]